MTTVSLRTTPLSSPTQEDSAPKRWKSSDEGLAKENLGNISPVPSGSSPFALRRRSDAQGRPSLAGREVRFFEKRPDIEGDSITINGTRFTLSSPVEGNAHRTYAFTGNGRMEIGEESFDVATLVLKVVKEIASDNLKCRKNPTIEVKKVVLEDTKAYEGLQRDGIPVPKWYVKPQSFVDSDNPQNGMFWVQEKMVRNVSVNWPISGQLTVEEKQLLDFVKDILTRSVNEGRELADDLYPRNVMYDSANQLRVVDAGDPEEGDLFINLSSQLLAWSNTNEDVFHYLISDFSEDWRKMMLEELTEQMERNGGSIPKERIGITMCV